VVRQVTKTSRN